MIYIIIRLTPYIITLAIGIVIGYWSKYRQNKTTANLLLATLPTTKILKELETRKEHENIYR